jgi:hypothetical protein
MKAKRLEFKYVHYDPDMICWGAGNHIIGPRLIARIQISKPSKEEEKRMKNEFAKAESVYEKFIRVGMRFKPCGKHSTNVIAKITFINNEKQTVTWKQINLTMDEIKYGLKPAAGKFNIGAMIHLYRQKEIQFLPSNNL